MLFNSYAFLFGFLPAAWAGYFALGRLSPLAAQGWLAVASLAFYAAAGWHSLHVLLGSILGNYAAGSWLATRLARGRSVRWPLRVAVAANLAVLAAYKYLAFLASVAGGVLGLDLALLPAVLPIGISFFTFTQIAFLVDIARGQAGRGEAGGRNPVHYLLFVTYFPHLIAGPLLHHQQVMPQFAAREGCRPRPDNVAIGLSIFLLGLFKKVGLADEVAVFANEGFAAAYHPIGFIAAWGGTLAYSLQIYFDFSAYSDMAVGLSLLFNIRLPANFNSPYQAGSIIEFWRRWHMTLSRFLRDYLYIPLGGSRTGTLRRHANLLATMLLGGLWHGAGWNFLIWGGLHGLYLMVNHFWRHACQRAGISGFPSGPVPRLGGWALTFLAVTVAWVFFRAPDLPVALAMLRGMAGLNGIAAPVAVNPRELALLGGLGAVALLAPNLAAITGQAGPPPPRWLQWRPTPGWAAACFALFVVSLLQMTGVSQFLYFQF